MPVIDLTVLTSGDIKAAASLAKQLEGLKIRLEDIAIASTKFNVESGEFVTKLVGVTKAGQAATIVIKGVGDAINAETVAIQNNAKATKDALIAKANLAKQQKAVSSARSILEGPQFDTTGYKPGELAKHREQITQILRLVAKSKDGYSEFHNALNATVSGVTSSLTEVEHRYFNILQRMTNKNLSVLDKLASDTKAKADKTAKDLRNKGDAQVARGTLGGHFNTAGFPLQKAQSFENKLESIYRAMEKGDLEFKDCADAYDVHFGHVTKDISVKAQKIVSTFRTLEAAEKDFTNKSAANLQKQKSKALLGQQRAGDAKNVRAALEGLFNTAGFSPEQANAQQARFGTIAKSIAKNTSDVTAFGAALNAYFTKSTAGLDEKGHQILKILNSIENYQNKIQNKLLHKGDAKLAKNTVDTLRTGGALDTKNLSITQSQKLENTLNSLYRQVGKGTVEFKNFQAAIDSYFRGMAVTITPEIQQVISIFQTLDATIKSTNKKKADKDKAKLDAKDLVAQQKKDAVGARKALESLFPQRGLNPEQSASQDARVNTIVRSVSKGTTELKSFNDAVTAYFTGIRTGLDEEAQKVLKILNNIGNYQSRVTVQNRKKAADAATRTANETSGKALLDAEKKKAQPNFGRLDDSARERVRNQFDRIQALFSKGLDPSGFVRAFEVANQGATHNLNRIEREVRHRLERINIELDRGGRKPIFSRLFGGGDGGGGIPTNWIKGAIFAQGITQVVSSLEAAVQKSAEYSRQVALIRTISQEAAISTNDWKSGLSAVSNILGRTREEVAQAGYDLLSNQITQGADSFHVLAEAGNLANTTNSRLVDSVNILSSAIQSFGLQATDTEKLSAAFFTTIDLGRVKIEQIANVFGRPALAAKTLGVSFQELAASIITISQTGIDVEQTNTLITNVFHKLLNPTKELQALYDKLGVSTGEMFVKTYGFTGVLKILQQETGGSVAKLAELFNEIRGEQGINALIDRLGIYEDALDKVTNSTEKYKKAIDEVNASSGQKFKVELQKINNYFDAWKDSILDITVKLGEWNGGLANTVVELTTFSSVILGGGTAVLLLTNRLDSLLITSGLAQKALVALRLQAATLAPILALGFAAFELGELAGVLYGLSQQYKQFYDDRRAELAAYRETANKEIEKIAEDFAAPIEELNKRLRQDNLKTVSNVVANLGQIEEARKEAFKDSGKLFENSSEVFLSGLKKKLEEIQSAIKEIDDLKKDLPKTRAGVNDHRRDFIYDYAHKVNELNVAHGGQDQGKQIDQKRLQQLRGDALKIFYDKQLTEKQRAEELNRIYDKRREILEHMATQTYTDPLTGQTELVYSVQKSTDRLRANDRERLAVLHAQNEALRVQKDILKKAEDEQKLQIKDAEDAVAKVAHFKAFDEGTGKLIKGTAEATLKQFDEYASEALKKLEEARKAGHGSGQDILSTRERLDNQRAKLADSLKVHDDREFVRKQQEEIAKATDPARRKSLQDASVAAGKEKGRAEDTAKAASENLVFQNKRLIENDPGKSTDEFGIGTGTGTDPKELEARRQAQSNLEYANKLIQGGQHGEAIKYFDQARGWAKHGGFLNDEIPGPQQDVYADGKKTGEKTSVPSTFGNQVTTARAAASTAQEAARFSDQTTKQFENTERQAGAAHKAIAETVEKYGVLIEDTETFKTRTKAAWDAAAANISSVNTELRTVSSELDTITKNAAITGAAILKINSGVAEQLNQAQQAAAKVGGGAQPKVSDQFTGGLIHRASGGLLYSPKGSDNIPVLAANHEFMMNQQSTARFLPQLIAMNSGFEPSFSRQSASASGDRYNFGDMHINVGGGQSGHQTAKDIVGGIKRGIRRGTLSI